ncbi:hypothetical protein CJP74_01260 [Psittacicella melopsittaci]|uniref:DUF4440 domain-containing protein n=1 Tax=Psittacicella melopsittaci TaxID=2028576 RepID=A0A3A1Y7Q2_9GAMM|nr:nuclear transport factor 2 family protein [Psittacicella melopsittaci]RIY33645.1 hypothetical protein CJP74_01260 [Psittacicella melopsittaci]
MNLDLFLQMYQQLITAMLEKDTSTLARLLTADFELIHMTGYVQSRQEWFSQILNGQMQYFSFTPVSQEFKIISPSQVEFHNFSKVDARIYGMHNIWDLKTIWTFTLQDSGQWLISHMDATPSLRR